MLTAPIIASWEGDGFKPWPRFAKVCDAEFVVGQNYHLEVIEERSAKSHSHFFASLSEAWKSLPDEAAERFPTAEALRKYALIRTGYHDSRSITTASKAEAARIAAFIRPADEFAIVTVTEATVTIYTAKSQSNRAMGKAVFQKSKTDVLDYVASLIGVRRDDLPEERAP